MVPRISALPPDLKKTWDEVYEFRMKAGNACAELPPDLKARNDELNAYFEKISIPPSIVEANSKHGE
jgi:hypothetical protein